jgi:uncharacterized protein (TIGR02302 family)
MAIRTPRPEKAFSPALRRKIDRARAALTVEGLWPRIAIVLSIAAGYVALSFFGAFSGTPLWSRIALALIFGGAMLAALVHLARWRTPGLEDGARRLDLSDPDLHRPLSTLTDRAAGSDPVAQALWKLHRERAEQAAARVAVPPPVSALPGMDRYAFRALAVLLLAAGVFVAGDERMGRFVDAFHFGAPRTPPVPPRLDAWVDPPPYTGKAPIFLSGPNAAQGAIEVPAGSTVVVRVAPGRDAGVTHPETMREKKPQTPAGPQPEQAAATAPNPNAAFEKRLAVDGSGVIDVTHGRSALARYDLRAIPDRAPKVDLLGIEPEEKGQSLRLRYQFEDDYGIARAEAVITRIGEGKRTLVPPPEVLLSGRLGENESLLTAPESPWAGARVSVRIRAEDDIGQQATSAAQEIVIPARRFENQVSRALVEQRRNIVLNPDDRRTPQIALDSLLVAPERFTRKSGDFIMLSMAARKMRTARNDADLVALAEYLWETAVALDEGNLSQAERNLRAIEERLREALERGAPPDEIRRLMDEMRQAMNEMLRELMDRAQRDPNSQQSDRNDPNQRSLTQRDLQDMLKRIEELYREGDTAKAQELLRQLQDLLKNLQTARRRDADPRMKELGEAMDELEKLQRDQEQLRDETFRNRRERADRQRQQRNQQQQRGQQGQRNQQGGDQDEQDGDGEEDEQDGDGEENGENGQEGMQGQNGQGQNGQQGRGLTERQQGLRNRLGKLRERLRQNGAPDQEGFDGADEGMGDAEQNLKQNNRGQAGKGQQKAIDELGKAGRGLSQQMQREMGDAQGEGEGEGMGPGEPNPNNQRGRAQQSTDPLGRPLPGDRNQMDNSRVRIPQGGNIQGTIGERAQKVLEELRRRLGEVERPREELEYIERLLRRN